MSSFADFDRSTSSELVDLFNICLPQGGEKGNVSALDMVSGVDLFGFGHGLGLDFCLFVGLDNFSSNGLRRGLISLLLEASVEGKGPRASDFGRLV